MTDASTGQGEQLRCDYCRLPCPEDPIVVEHEGVEYDFCSEPCRDALEAKDQVFTEYHGYRTFEPDVSAMDAGLPQGMPRNSFVLLSGRSGSRDEALQAELVWRTLQRDEPVVIVTFLESPTAIVQQFVTLEWNILPYLASGQLHILDCFTYRLEDRDAIIDRMDEWNSHLHDIVREVTTHVRDPTNVSQVRSRLDDCLDALEMDSTGIVVVDSLTELGTLVQPVKSYDFVKNVRADVCKGRFVPVFAGATLTGDGGQFPHDLGYMVDGVVDLDFTTELVKDTLIKQLRIRKMNGVLTIPEWFNYEFTSGEGLVVFDPEEEMKKAREERADEEAERATTEESESESDEESTENPYQQQGTTGQGPARQESGSAPGAEASSDDSSDDSSNGSSDNAAGDSSDE